MTVGFFFTYTFIYVFDIFAFAHIIDYRLLFVYLFSFFHFYNVMPSLYIHTDAWMGVGMNVDTS
jgi:hypothetical protein